MSNKIYLDIDRDRIIEIVDQAIEILSVDFGEEFYRSKEEIIADVRNILSSGKVAVDFFVSAKTKKIPDLSLKIDPVKKKVLCVSFFKRKIKEINCVLRNMR